MELIPVFSLIVLVVTIGTFILAVGAYVMFRVRERRPQPHHAHAPEAYEAEVIAPELIGTPQPASPAAGSGRRDFAGDQKRMIYPPESHQAGDRPGAEDRRRWG